ncbi:family 43 glycosylhydrolase [Sphingomonas sp. AOB5]|uniref:family 43 glycosylhydrolase n=1 Tax=Sphingomonas sp. AOB5 TaxID=3034017 RepID=UPI0023F99C64|nr:family 43 glycosylhydrolase [Sphingomonas sp. AOB5]MDF7776377.1 family 43 glycosylhydrolase [Sphingomonas sp. AOB5]
MPRPTAGWRGPFRVAILGAIAAGLVSGGALAQIPEEVPPGAPETPYVDPAKAYLFAHMTSERYGVLFYSVSLDGLHWRRLNGGKPVSEDYHGHPSITRAPDGRYILVGNKSDSDPFVRFWSSRDLITWTPAGSYQPDLSSVRGLPNPLQRLGAPKLFYDKASGQYLLTWHTPNVPHTPADPERYWASQRTLYVTSKDLKTFDGPPKLLFDWDIATIDTIIMPGDDGKGYCAVIKDERYPSYNWTTGKTVRISCAASLLGPYPMPGPAISPNFREAPTIIRAPNNRDWLAYYEQYAGQSYGVSKAPRLEGPWYQLQGNSGVKRWNRFEMPEGTRHGFMIEISRKEYDGLVAAFPEGTAAKP